MPVLLYYHRAQFLVPGIPYCFTFLYSLGYTYLGCWIDTYMRAVPPIEGSDPRIRGDYQRRRNAINKCFQVAKKRNMVLFALQHGGYCTAARNFNGYMRYGKSDKCRNGKGGVWANDVYHITSPKGIPVLNTN